MKKPQRRSYCQRSGVLLPIGQLEYEPGTGLLVDKKFNDKRWNRVTTPQKDIPRPSRTEGKLRFKHGPNTDAFQTAGTLLSVEVDGVSQPLRWGEIIFRTAA
jgi:hypothetical protein